MTIVTPSTWLSERAEKSFLKNKPITVIHNGIDTDIFQAVKSSKLRTELGIPEDNRIVLSLAPNIMSEAKGGNWVLKLADGLKNEKITFVLVGADKAM